MRWSLAFTLGICALAALIGGTRHLPLPLSACGVFLLPGLLWLSRKPLARLPSKKAPLAVFLFAAALRLVPVVLVDNAPISGLEINRELSRSILAGRGVAVNGPAGTRELETYVQRTYAQGEPTAFFPPGAAFWGAALGANAALFKLANVLLGAGTCVLIYRIGAAADPLAGALAALLWAAHPSSVFSVTEYGAETLFAFFLTLLAWLVSRKEPGILSGLDAAWCALIHPPWTTLLMALGAVWLPGRAGLKKLALCALFLLIGLAPWTARNWLRFHRVISVSTDEGVALAVLTAIHAPRLDPQDSVLGFFRAPWEAGGEAEKSALGYRIGAYYLLATMKEGPAFMLRAAADGMARAFGTDSDVMLLATAKSYELKNGLALTESALSDEWLGRWLTLNHIYYVGLLALAVFGCCRASVDKLLGLDGARFLGVYFLIMWSLLAAIPGVDRYHFSLMIPVALLAGHGAAALTR